MPAPILIAQQMLYVEPSVPLNFVVFWLGWRKIICGNGNEFNGM